MKSFIVSLFVSISFASIGSIQALAEPGQKFSCSNVAGIEEWTIYIDLDQKKAGFFDNDSTVVVPFTQMRLLESIPPQRQYTFEGADSNGSDQIRIVFNKTRMQASIILSLGQDDERQEESLDGCEEDDNFILN
jgi:hypothetical protein